MCLFFDIEHYNGAPEKNISIEKGTMGIQNWKKNTTITIRYNNVEIWMVRRQRCC